MIPALFIIFREVLEIAIILSIVMAATRGVCGRGKFVALGLTGGVAGALLVAVFASNISDALEGIGQEVFNGSVLLLASAMIAWTTLWMQTHGRELSQKIKHVGTCVRDGTLPLTSIAVVVALSMWREGAEIALFMAGILSTSNESVAAVVGGALAGGVAAAAIGVLIYAGLLKLSNKYLFSVTGWLLILLASGMSAAGAGFLVAADVLPALIPQVWDSSALLSEGSILGRVLHAMFGYSERPCGMQLLFYVATLGGILLLLRLRKTHALLPHFRKATVITAVAVLAVAAGHQAYAAFAVDFLKDMV